MHLRSRSTWLVAVGLVASAAFNTAGTGAATTQCAPSWTIKTNPNPGKIFTMFQDVDASSPTDAWAVGTYINPGSTYNNGGGLRALAQHYDGTAWTNVKAPNVTGSDNVLTDVVDLSPSDAWAVGWENTHFTLVEHWNGTSWSVVTSPNPGSRRNFLTAVDASSSTDAWAVGWDQGSSGLHSTLALRYQGSTWDVVSTPNTTDPSANLSAVADIASNDVWAGGYSSSSIGTRTLMMHWDGTTWTIVPSPNLVPDGNDTITDIAAISSDDVWAVGYATSGSNTVGLTMHWDGTSWSLVSTPAPSSLTMLRGVVAVSSANVWAVGVSWDTTIGNYTSLTEHWDGTRWTVVAAAPTNGENYLTGAAAVPSSGDLWAVGWHPAGKTPLNALVQSRCGTTVTGATAAHHRAGRTLPAAPTASQPISARGTEPAATARPAGTTTRRHTATGRAGVPQSAVAVDMSGPAGLAQTTSTFSGAVADFNKDGWPDLFDGHHLQSSQLFENHQGVFTEIDKGQFPGYPDDRHGCVWIDANRDGLLDLFCVQGGERGTIVHHNDLLIQQPNHTFMNRTGQFGLLDPYGRGWLIGVLDVNRDGYSDLFLSNDTIRGDGMPGPNRLYMSTGKLSYADTPSLGLDTEASESGCARGGDFTGDGWPDLMVCSGYGQGLILYQNNSGNSFTNVSAQMAAPGGKVKDAVLADMNGDGALDLVYVSASRLMVAVQQNGIFHTAFSTSSGLTTAARVAVADVNDDGFPDIYVLQGHDSANNEPDDVFVNDGSGTAFSSVTIPETTAGCGDDVLPIDYDRNGLSDFVVLNGCNSIPGPVQLIAFFPAGSAQLRGAQEQAQGWAVSHGPGRVPAAPKPIGEPPD
jgi:hypothetical protein